MDAPVRKYRVQPYTDAERPRCAGCGCRLTVSAPEQVRLEPLDEASFTTNRRIVHRKQERVWFVEGERGAFHADPSSWARGKVTRGVGRITLTFAVDPEERRRWGYDGAFHSLACAYAFAHAALRAGYRRKG